MGHFEDRFREPVPAGLPGCGEVPGTRCRPAAGQRMCGDLGDQGCRRGGADLVGNHVELIASGPHPQHRAHEVGAMVAIHPGGAEDEMPAAAGDDGLLACKLAGTVHPQWCGRIVLAIGSAALAIEHVVGRVMHQQRIDVGASLRQNVGRMRIDRKRQLWLILRAVHSGVGCCIDHYVGRDVADQRREAVAVREIDALAGSAILQRAVARGRDQIAQRSQACPGRMPDLAVGAQQQDPHRSKSGSRSAATSARNGARASFSDRAGSETGQSIPMAASFQRTPASAARSYWAVHR